MFSKVTQVGSIFQLPPSIESLQWCKIPPPDGNSTDTGDDVTDFDRLLPTLIECFAIVICGFLAGRCHIISASNIKGLGDFTTYFTLPPLIFLNLVTINLEHVNWLFILGILLGKVVVFALVAFITAAVQRPTNFGYAGLYAIFCTQGNDFGLAYPIVASLYGSTRPLYPSYMYLIAPTSLIVTNPIGFLLMEVENIRTKKDFDPKAGICKTLFLSVGSVSWAVIKNPVVFVTLLGIAGNFLFYGGLPSVVYGILQILSSAFSASVLFLLGFSVVGSGSSMSGAGLLIPGVLLVTKMLASPLITRATVALLCVGAPDVSDLSDYGFLYGMVPTGPIVMLFAAEYCLRTEMLASTMIVCTALFGPVMFVLARMFALKVKGMEEFSGELKQTMFVLSILSFLSCVWIASCLIFSKKWKHYVYKITLCLLASQIIMAVGIFTWGMLPAEQDWIIYFQVVFITAGQLMSRVWTTLLAVTLVIKQRKPSSPFVQKLWYPLGFGFGFPAALVIILLIATGAGKCYPNLDRELPLFMYGYSEAIAAIVILFVCLVITTSCLVLYYRSLKWKDNPEGEGARRSSEGEVESQAAVELGTETVVRSSNNLADSTEYAIYKLTNAASESNVSKAANKIPASESTSEEDVSGKNVWNFPPLLKHSETSFSQSHLLSPEVSDNSGSSQSLDVVSMTSGSSNEENDADAKNREIPRSRLRHVVLLILLCISIAVGLTVSSWKLTTGHPNGLFVAMEFLDAVLNIGQGLFASIVFIKDSKYILSPIAKWLRKVRYGVYSLDIHTDEMDDVTRQQCHQFITYHYNNCMRDLPKTVMYKHQSYSKSFIGRELVDWLITVGLAKNRSEAELYGQRLLRGGVLTSVNEAVQFHDNGSYLYRLKNALLTEGYH